MAGASAREPISYEQAGELLGVHHRTVRKWENGEREAPAYLALACAALLHGLPPFEDHSKKLEDDDG